MTDAANERDELDEYEELDADQMTEDAIEYFDEPTEADSPASDADAPPPG